MKVLLSLVLALALVVLCSASQCPPDVEFWPVTENCRQYIVCPRKGRGPLIIESCFPLIRRFNRLELHCDWFWNVECSATPRIPTLAPWTILPSTTPTTPF